MSAAFRLTGYCIVSWLVIALASCGAEDSTRRERDTPGGAGDAGSSSEAGAGQAGPAAGESGAGGYSAGAAATSGGEAGAADVASLAGAGGQNGAGQAGVGGEGGAASVEVTVTKHFNLGVEPCGLGFDSEAQQLWVIGCFGTQILSYSTEGTAGLTIDAPGEDADDVDVDFSPTALQLGSETVEAHTALFFNGETDALDIYAGDKSGQTTTPIAMSATAFGNSHVVGGAFHAERGTFFAVQDRVPAGALANRVAELDSSTGAVINEFSLLPHFDVNYGDLDVCQSSGNVLIVSSTEDVVAELTPEGELIAKYPADVAGLSGIAIDDTTGDAWVAAPNGDVWRLEGLPCLPFEP